MGAPSATIRLPVLELQEALRTVRLLPVDDAREVAQIGTRQTAIGRSELGRSALDKGGVEHRSLGRRSPVAGGAARARQVGGPLVSQKSGPVVGAGEEAGRARQLEFALALPLARLLREDLRRRVSIWSGGLFG